MDRAALKDELTDISGVGDARADEILDVLNDAEPVDTEDVLAALEEAAANANAMNPRDAQQRAYLGNVKSHVGEALRLLRADVYDSNEV